MNRWLYFPLSFANFFYDWLCGKDMGALLEQYLPWFQNLVNQMNFIWFPCCFSVLTFYVYSMYEFRSIPFNVMCVYSWLQIMNLMSLNVYIQILLHIFILLWIHYMSSFILIYSGSRLSLKYILNMHNCCLSMQVMLLGFVLLGRSLEERARLQASSDMNELLVSSKINDVSVYFIISLHLVHLILFSFLICVSAFVLICWEVKVNSF